MFHKKDTAPIGASLEAAVYRGKFGKPAIISIILIASEIQALYPKINTSNKIVRKIECNVFVFKLTKE